MGFGSPATTILCLTRLLAPRGLGAAATGPYRAAEDGRAPEPLRVSAHAGFGPMAQTTTAMMPSMRSPDATKPNLTRRQDPGLPPGAGPPDGALMGTGRLRKADHDFWVNPVHTYSGRWVENGFEYRRPSSGREPKMPRDPFPAVWSAHQREVTRHSCDHVGFVHMSPRRCGLAAQQIR